jgi:hypothetical protein
LDDQFLLRTAGAIMSGVCGPVHSGGHEDLFLTLDQGWQVGPDFLCPAGVWVVADGRFDAFVGGLVVVFLDGHDPAVAGLPPVNKPGTVTELDREQVSTEELVEGREILCHGIVDAHPVDHLASAPSPRVR